MVVTLFGMEAYCFDNGNFSVITSVDQANDLGRVQVYGGTFFFCFDQQGVL